MNYETSAGIERGAYGLRRAVDVDSRIFQPGIFPAEPLTQREAWTWLRLRAAHDDRIDRAGRRAVKVKPGQLAASLRELASAWGWGGNSQCRVGRFLASLEEKGLIAVDDASGVTVVSILRAEPEGI
jgi:hypothetical protein